MHTSGKTSPDLSAPPLLDARDALFLDFDGTLTEIAPRPELVYIEPTLTDLIEGAQRLVGGAVAVVSGRPLKEIDHFLMPLQLPGAGQHGAELRMHGNATPQRRVWPGVAAAAFDLRGRFGGDGALIVEQKGAAVAVHYRAAPERADECIAVARAVAEAHGLDVLVGKMVVETRPRGLHKGLAVDALLSRPLFRGRRPVFIGDDTTDEDGFDEAASRGGYGIKVGDGETRARYRLESVAAVHEWLQDSVRAGVRERA
ncbi:trehalose-phosphatase [Solimonas marina]|uniref:Trehalose 6-phosphate phosphatase n=1 Tax=Solimonas marina TaxID=2714601 RepID=A0A969W8B1_9GAMM|nr:trehalose-phosphatase [Solimonas marina]NKF22257.1 trehalose-phosphatase [Solimonas marina]